MTVKKLYTLAAIYFGCLYSLITIPFTVNFFNRIHPIILGLPFFQFSIIGFIFMNLLGLFALFNIEDRIARNNRRETGGNS